MRILCLGPFFVVVPAQLSTSPTFPAGRISSVATVEEGAQLNTSAVSAARTRSRSDDWDVWQDAGFLDIA
ncbi:MAG: hypothetical protein CL928_07370 [Deltaproteobacteria bacterium]|nr:hypothetical protein [Deltaproteobacteria bacterium]